MCFDLKALIALPRGPGKPSGARRAELLPVARQQVQALFEVLAHFPDRRRPTAGKRLEQKRSANVHHGAVIGLLELEERSVERRQLIIRGHRGMTPHASSTMCANDSGSRLAPPTSAPSTSGRPSSSSAFSGLSEPP